MTATTTTKLRPEAELLLRCAQTRDEAERDERIRALIQKGIDWTYLLRTASMHGTLPLLYWQLNAVCAEAVPEDIMQELRNHFHANGRRNLFLTGELLKLLGALEAQAVPAIPYKGPTLAIDVYENLALREFGDLDILVHKRDVTKARGILNSIGYQQQEQLAGAQEEAFLRSQCEYIFASETGSVVELHWAIVPRKISFSFDTEDLWTRLERITLGGATVPIFSPEDMLLILCVHGSKHRWRRLTWICDVAELIRAHRDLKWQQIMERAGALGGERMLLLGLFLANDLLRMDLPDHVLRRVKSDRSVNDLAGLVTDQLFREDEGVSGLLDESSFRPLYLGMRERLSDKIRYCLHTAMSQTTEDWELVPLPRYLFPLYYLLRLIRLTGKYGRRLFRRGL